MSLSSRCTTPKRDASLKSPVTFGPKYVFEPIHKRAPLWLERGMNHQVRRLI